MIHTHSDVMNIDIAYTSASTAEYQVESHHPNASAPVAAATEHCNVCQRFGLRESITHLAAANIVLARKKPAKAVKSPLDRFTSNAAHFPEGASIVITLSTSIHVGLPGG